MDFPTDDFEQKRLAHLIQTIKDDIAEYRKRLAAYKPVENRYDQAYRTYYEGLIWSHEQMLKPLLEMKQAAKVVLDFTQQWNLRN